MPKENDLPAVDTAMQLPALARGSLRRSLTAMLTRRYPFFSGCGSFANSRIIQLLSGNHSGAAWCGTAGGRLLAPLDDYIGRAAYFAGDLDRKISWICRQIVRPGDTVLDVGANIGLVSLLLARLAGPTGCVHAFEPQPRLAAMLRKSLSENHYSNVVLHSIALGDSPGILQMHIPGHNAGAATLVDHRISGDSATLQVQVRRLDDVLSEAGVGGIRLMKIDVEGYEAEVLRGAEVTLRERRPDAILFELNDGKSSFSENPVVRLLRSHHYEFFAIPRCLARMKLVRIPDETQVARELHDFLACPSGRVAEEIAVRVHC